MRAECLKKILAAIFAITLFSFPNSFCFAGGSEERMTQERLLMVERQIAGRDVTDPLVLEAMREVKRHDYVPSSETAHAYEDRPLPIGEGQTISQPYIVAKMSELLCLRGNERVLEIGTGSGYQAAVLARLAIEVYSIEIVVPLCEKAKALLKSKKIDKVKVRCGDGYKGWPEAAPFDAIMLTAAPREIPKPLLDQLKPGGRLVAPVGDWNQQLVVVVKDEKGKLHRQNIFPVRFVPMTGEARRKE